MKSVTPKSAHKKGLVVVRGQVQEPHQATPLGVSVADE